MLLGDCSAAGQATSYRRQRHQSKLERHREDHQGSKPPPALYGRELHVSGRLISDFVTRRADIRECGLPASSGRSPYAAQGRITARSKGCWTAQRGAAPCSQVLATAVQFRSTLQESRGGLRAATAQSVAARLGFGVTTSQAKWRSRLAREPSTATYGVISVLRCVDAQSVAA